MAFKTRAASVHNGSVRWKEPDLAGSAQEQAILDQLRHHAVSSKLAVTTSLTELWDVLRRGDSPTSFLSTMNTHSLRARSLCNPLMHEDTPLRLADSVLRASHHVLIQDFSDERKTLLHTQDIQFHRSVTVIRLSNAFICKSEVSPEFKGSSPHPPLIVMSQKYVT